MKLIIRSDKGESVELDVLGKLYEDGLGGYWLSVAIEIILDGYHASIGGTHMVTGDLNKFRSQVIKMYEEMKGFADLNAIEELITLRAELDKTGHVLWKGQTRYPIGVGNVLQFQFHSDQSYLPELISQLNSIMDFLSK